MTTPQDALMLVEWPDRLGPMTPPNRLDLTFSFSEEEGDIRHLTITGYGDFRRVQAGEPDPIAGKPLKLRRGIEVGHIFILGTKYSDKFGALYMDDQKQNHAMVARNFRDRTLAHSGCR